LLSNPIQDSGIDDFAQVIAMQIDFHHSYLSWPHGGGAPAEFGAPKASRSPRHRRRSTVYIWNSPFRSTGAAGASDWHPFCDQLGKGTDDVPK
jgi:hypothetical protein